MTKDIVSNLFDLIEGSVLELGPHDGSWFTGALLNRSSQVSVIELDSNAVSGLTRNCPGANVIQDDYHTAVKTVGYFDNVVLFGVLTHTPSPLGLLEDIVNYVKPARIFIEAEPGGVVRCVRESNNEPGQRQSALATCGLSIQLGTRIYKDALENLGYKPIRSYLEKQGDKAGFEYTVYDLLDN